MMPNELARLAAQPIDPDSVQDARVISVIAGCEHTKTAECAQANDSTHCVHWWRDTRPCCWCDYAAPTVWPPGLIARR